MRKALGRKLSAALSATLVVYQLGSCAAYLIIIGDTVGPLLANGFGADAWFASRRVVITFFALVIIMPLCFPRCGCRRQLCFLLGGPRQRLWYCGWRIIRL